MSTNPYINFCRLAVKEFEPSKGAKFVKKTWPILLFILAWIVGGFLGIPYLDVVKAAYRLLAWQWWIVIGLAFAVLCLLFVIEGVRRLHERTVNEANADFKVRARTIEKLSFVNGLAQEIDHRYWQDEKPSKREVEIWCGYLTTALHDSYGTDGLAIFTHGRPEAMEVPDDPYLWFRMTRDRLSRLISEQLQSALVARKAGLQKR